MRKENGEGILTYWRIKEKLFSTLFGKDLEIGTANGLPKYVEERLHRMKVLIVLDDVNDS